MFETLKHYFPLLRGSNVKCLRLYSSVSQEEQDPGPGQSIHLAPRKQRPFHTAIYIYLGIATLIAVLGIGTGVVAILLIYRPQQEAFEMDQGAHSTSILPSGKLSLSTKHNCSTFNLELTSIISSVERTSCISARPPLLEHDQPGFCQCMGCPW